MRRSGFTLIEMIIVLGVLGVTAGLSVPIYRDYQIESDLNLATEQVAQGIERARLLSQGGAEDDAWGFYVPAGVLYKGDSYENRDPAFDEVYPMPSTIKVRPGLNEVAYSKVDGRPSETGEVTLTTINDAERTINIEVYQQSIAVTTPDTITICIDGMPVAVQEHEVPTDPVFPVDGSCEAVIGSASSEAASEGTASSEDVASSVASEGTTNSPAASEAASSVPASAGAASSVLVVGGGSSVPGDEEITCDRGEKLICHVPPGNPGNRHTLCVGTSAWPVHRAHGDTEGACAEEIDEPVSAPLCTDRFSIAEDGLITVRGDLAVTVTVLGSEITFGAGGPEINVDLSYKVNGNKWKSLFQGKDVDGGESEVTPEIPAGASFAVNMHGKYKQRNWLRFQESYTTNDETGHFSVFRNGAPLPNYPAFGGQQELASFLDGYLTEDGKVSIGQYDVLLLGELGASLTGESADFQDIVVLLQFGQPTCE